MTQAASPERSSTSSSGIPLRLALLGALFTMGLLIWGSQIYFTRYFTESQSPDARLRATLFAGSIRNAMQRHSVVPLLLARDPVLAIALRAKQYGSATERLTAFSEEIGAGAILLLDADGNIVASSEQNLRESYDGDKAHFTRAISETGTVFSITQNGESAPSFNYARQIAIDDQLLGVVVVTVDLAQIEEGWRLARLRVIVTDSEDRVLLASDPRWRNTTVDALISPGPEPSPLDRVIRNARERIGASNTVYIAGTPHILAQVPVGFRNWNLDYFASLDDVRARVNAILALMIMALALMTALAFYLLSRKAQAESHRIQSESDELRGLNRRLSSEIATRLRVERNLKHAEQSLEQASKLAALGQMSAAVSHELNQPLAAMKTYLAGARMLLDRRRPEEALSSFQRIDDLIDRMGGITRQLKSYARKGDLELDPVDLRACVRSALNMMSPQLGKMAVEITTTLPSEPVMVLADSLRLEQIIVNLLRNALDAVSSNSDPQIKLLLAADETILLSVEDNGTGLRDPDRLFEPFYTTKKAGEGLGLGLAISAGFAAQMGGKLMARNASGHGAVFELILPREPSQAQAAE